MGIQNFIERWRLEASKGMREREETNYPVMNLNMKIETLLI